MRNRRHFLSFCILHSAFCIGCVTPRAQIEQEGFANPLPSAHLQQVANAYCARCPDVLRVDIDGLPQYSGPQRIGPDGRINLGDSDQSRVDGQTTAEISRTVAETLSVPPEQVHVAVLEYNSQYLYLYGQVAGLERAVPYQGPETVLDLLRRVGGLSRGATPHDIKVVRPHIADGKVPEVFRIDLTAIVVRHDVETNIVLEPCDQVYVGQSRRSSFGDCLPPWLRPLYERMCGMKRRM
ncbi:MAG TPA: polysaccharide biosynthesis/export family protein [Gemmataceae bacterium]|jgi:protein involved in polysaccharide export with SLBB domain